MQKVQLQHADAILKETFPSSLRKLDESGVSAKSKARQPLMPGVGKIGVDPLQYDLLQTPGVEVHARVHVASRTWSFEPAISLLRSLELLSGTNMLVAVLFWTCLVWLAFARDPKLNLGTCWRCAQSERATYLHQSTKRCCFGDAADVDNA